MGLVMGTTRRFQYRFRAVGTLLSVAVATLTLVASGLYAVQAQAAEDCGPNANAIVCENSKPGAPWQEWEINGAGDDTIQGFSTDISVNAGKRIDFKIDTDASAYTIDIYRTGWYQGLGARKVASVAPSAALPQRQLECLSDVSTELVDCGTWAVSASWQVPSDAVSGVYFAKLTRTDTGGASHITFVVRNDSSKSDILLQTSDPTWHAYNTYGGSDFYSGAANGRAFKVSYNRPFATRGGVEARDFYFGAEYPLVRFLERNGYDVSYFSGIDTDRRGELLKNHKVFMSVGHDEYWSGQQRTNVEAARDAGVNLQFLTGNEVYWRTRYEPSTTTNTDYRTLVTYKETWANGKIDPAAQWTGTWRDPRYAALQNGAGSPENSLTGVQYMVNHGDLPVTVDSREGKLRLWRDTSLTSMADGTKTELAPHTVGYESDEDVDNGFRPGGLIKLSTTKGAVPEYLQDFGNTVAPGETTHNLTLYRAASGALVFSAGSVQWSWGLDDWHDGDGAPADPRMQQAQLNMLSDMGVQPTRLMSGLASPTPSTDQTAPTATVTSGPTGKVKHGEEFTVEGTATDVGGQVAGVEYSMDQGSTWKAAAGTENWSFSDLYRGLGTTSVLVRAIDDSANYPQTALAVPINVTGPYSVFGQEKPIEDDAGDSTPAEFGLRFTPTADGFVTGVKFYKSAANTGSHSGSLWTLDGTRIATVAFTNESASGWQKATFDEPTPVQAGTEYIVSYSAPAGHYTADTQYFAYRGKSAPPMSVTGGFGSTEAGVYNTNGEFPTTTFQRSNYYVDALFETLDGLALTAGAQTPSDTAVSVAPTTPIGATLSKPVAADDVKFVVKDATGTSVPGRTEFDASSYRATFVPEAALADGETFTVTLSAKDSNGNSIERGGQWSFRTMYGQPANGECPCSLMPDSATPTLSPIKESVPVTLGMEFSTDIGGTVDGLKYYRLPDEKTAPRGRLYSEDGALLGQVTFDTPSVSGWQYVAFESPVRISPDTNYVIAYDSAGTYSGTPGYFSSGLDVGPLHTAPDAGRYTYSSGAFPNKTSSTNYQVDLRFTADAPPVSITERSPAANAYDIGTDQALSVEFSEPLIGNPSLSVEAGGETVNGQSALSSDRKKLTFTPSQTLPELTKVTVEPVGIEGEESGEAVIEAWSFHTASTTNPLSSYLEMSEPSQTDPDDNASVELGARLKTADDIVIHAVRYYKGPRTSGSHTGTLWDSNGSALATVAFPQTSGQGWQVAFLGAPISLSAGSTFTVSYSAPNGGYVFTPAAFADPQPKGSLSLVDDNGLFKYGQSPILPTNSWNKTNYFADVLYTKKEPAN